MPRHQSGLWLESHHQAQEGSLKHKCTHKENQNQNQDKEKEKEIENIEERKEKEPKHEKEKERKTNIMLGSRPSFQALEISHMMIIGS